MKQFVIVNDKGTFKKIAIPCRKVGELVVVKNEDIPEKFRFSENKKWLVMEPKTGLRIFETKTLKDIIPKWENEFKAKYESFVNDGKYQQTLRWYEEQNFEEIFPE